MLKIGDRINFISDDGDEFKDAEIYDISKGDEYITFSTYSKSAEKNRAGHNGDGRTEYYGCWNITWDINRNNSSDIEEDSTIKLSIPPNPIRSIRIEL